MKTTVLSSFLPLLLLLSFTACQPQQTERWHIAYKHTGEGKLIQGDKNQLFSTIRAGKQVRIGWGWKSEERGLSIEHLADPIWLAILNEQEVIAHLDPQVLSAIDWETNSANYADSSLFDQEWRVVINTSGAFDAVWYNRKNQEVSRRVPQAHTVTWFVDDMPLATTAPLFIKE